MKFMAYFLFFVISVLFSWLLTPAIKKLAYKFKILDFPNSIPRKIHAQPTPLLGGISVFSAFAIVVLIYIFTAQPDFKIIPLKFYLAILLGGATLILGGILDDKYNLPPKFSWLFPGLASLIVVASGIGIGITELSNPFGPAISIQYAVLTVPLSGIIMWLWLMGMIYTTKFLDGLDGLTSAVSFIGSLTIFALSLTEKVNQPITASLAIILSGCFLGFLFYNFHPASIFLGEGGSTFAGFALGVLAIILGAKITTALLVMGIPILDVAWVIIRRFFYRSSPFSGDRSHLHYKLLDIGFSQKQTVFALCAISSLFGFTAVFLQSLGKLIALVFLFCVMIFLAITVVVVYKKQHPHVRDLFDSIDEKVNK